MAERTISDFHGKVALIEWFDNHRRPLPWRNHSNPYAIWLSEIILQQTRVDQGLPYWERFMDAFPTVESLAAAPTDHIMALWAGLGYYSRARNLHAAAKLVAAHGAFPRTRDGLLALPGVGPYTAAAIASMAFQEVVPALDGNALRVYSRYFAVADRIDQRRTVHHIESLATPLLDPERPGDSNQAIMDLGSRICTPTRPQCGHCPLQPGCEAHLRGSMESFPIKAAKKRPQAESWTLYVPQWKGKFGLVRRPSSGIWSDLWCFPTELPPYLQSQPDLQTKHLLSHRSLTLDFHGIEGDFDPLEASWTWFTLEEVKKLGLPVPIRWWFEEKNYF
ncbi:MAG: A/G-specific adenine glycosylase [Bacteroidetes bacterium]|nr:A/G-specific adenine glycosylase [Bacteroidota bacterium]MDA0828038.1 A/G-specific adenine glycosylase [Bacteroidota bacterium]MDA1199527.1 A/G-specific adenine glycosylase [Bacteroidota bacterium]